MAAQMNYGYSTPKGFAGSKFDLTPIDEVVTRQNEEKDGVLGFGVAVVQGTSAGASVKLPTSDSTADKFEGIVLHQANTEQDRDGKVIVKNGVSLGIVRHGHVWGKTASDAVPAYGAKAYVVISGEDAGKFTEKSDGTVDIGAKFGRYTDDGIAVIEL